MLVQEKIIAIGCDHAGYHLKKYLKEILLRKGYEIKDFGTNSDGSMDYPDTIHPLANSVDKGEYNRAIIICGSGNGVCMTANKYNNVRAALCWNTDIVELARLHNDANILALPARYISKEEGFKFVSIFLNTEFEGGRHLRRVNKIRK